MITALQNFIIDEVTELRFLLHGPVGAGKSSIINTINTIFEEHQFINCLAASELAGVSFTKKFQPEASISENNKDYISNPTLNDQIHCLISVVAADKVTIMKDEVIQKMKAIRAEASKLGIPQLVFLTRGDQVCKMTQKDVTKIYRSKKIKEKMEQCSVRLGVPVNCIFPVKNYHEETKANSNLNCLMLEGLTQAVHSAQDFVKKASLKQKAFRPEVSISEDNKYYISNPTLNNKIHCLISVVAADRVTLMNDGVIQKMKTIRVEASKLEFESVLADKEVKEGGYVTLRCKAKHTEGVTAQWEKNNQSLRCVTDKHKINQSDAEFTLEIKKAEKEDEGKYTLTLQNESGSASCSAMVTLGGKLAGAHQDDIIKALKGHVPDDYEFRSEASISEDDSYYISNPTLNNKIHCLISVVAADKVTLMDGGVIQKMKTIRAEASKLVLYGASVYQRCWMPQQASLNPRMPQQARLHP
ncbi:hypothetical protein NFI96_008783 [Prochilodus magdalenae]|nr:hypothetical protein NFI96_008783 [Prochilodus magdalenae]